MPLRMELGDVLEARADALLLAVDGMARNKPDPARPIRGGREILGGNIANQFAKRWPEDWEDLQRDVRYPVPIGRTVAVPLNGDCPWRLILFASTLHHLDVLDERQKRSVIRTSLTEALQLCVRHQATTLATALLQGGWRLSAEDALQEMRSAYHAAGCPQVRLVVCQMANDLPDV